MKKTHAIRLLERESIPYELLEYSYDPENLDVQKIAEDNQLDIQTVYKTLVAKGNKSGLVVAVIPGDKRLNRKVLAKASANKKISLVPIPDLEKLTGYIRGGCCPIGMKSSPPVYIDSSAEALGSIWVNAGIRGLLMKVKTTDLLRISSGELLDIGELA